MATPVISTAFVSGEISPSVFGRVDLEREHVAATTMRNMFVNVRGGAYSRAGLAFVGFSKQTGHTHAPRLIPFQFSINQGLMLEFGQQYMRVMLNGAFVTLPPFPITGVTRANPAVLSATAFGVLSAIANTGGVTQSYAPADLVTIAGGIYSRPAVLAVTTSELVGILAKNRGTGYAVNDTITLGGGTFSTAAVAKVTSLRAVKASGSILYSAIPSDGNTVVLNGVTWTFKTTPTTTYQTKIQPTLAGTMNQLANNLNGSSDAGLTVATYSATDTSLVVTYDTTGAGGNAYTLAITGSGTPSSGTLTGGTTTGVGNLSINNAGVFSVLPPAGNMTQTATSGGGTGASFQSGIFGPHAVTVSDGGIYASGPVNPAQQASTDGNGLGATFTLTFHQVAAFADGDWVYISGVGGMTELNGNTYVLELVPPFAFNLKDVYGNYIDSTGFHAYTAGGTAAVIFTVPTQYNGPDLPYLKYTQSADVMTLCCVNTVTGTEYPAVDLSRISDTEWVFNPIVAQSSINPPNAVTAAVSDPDGTTNYSYQVTAIAPDDGTESRASKIANATGISIFVEAGQVNIQWKAVLQVNQYNIYKAQPSDGSPVPVGSLYGYIGSAYGTSFIDSNILADFAQVPPRHVDPFARGQIAGVRNVAGGSGYTTATATITTSTGDGASIEVIVQDGAVVGYVIDDTGHDYADDDTIDITGDGTGAAASLIVGPQSGTYPSVPGYFQERRAFANTLNQPDTYFMSQPGAFTNFDSRIPPIATDAIIGSPWSVQVNGIQWMIQTSGGLLVMTGLSAWLLAGTGSFATNVQAISPSTQDDVPQAFTGVSPTVMPLKINYDIIYVNSKGSYYYALPYQLYVLSEPVDLTELSTHLFIGHTVLENTWCEQPSKLMWAVRNDGILLSLTYYKTQAISGWARHDTNGLFCSVASITEPPIDALYVATQRFPGGKNAYMIERMDNRLWESVEDVWAVDAALSLPQPAPTAKLSANTATGLGSLTGVTGLVGGANYSAGTTAAVVDDNGNGPGAGAVVALTIVAGVITAVAFTSPGVGYVRPKLVFSDPANAGSGASARVTLNNAVTFTADAAVFVIGDVGKVIRMGGGIATVTAYVSTTQVTAQIISPIVSLIPNSGGQVLQQAVGAWTMTRPVTTITGLGHLVGATVTGLADGNVITPRVVQSDGSIVLDAPASAVTIGLGFEAQLQGVYFEAGSPSAQGQRKKVAAVNALVEASRGMKTGGAQPDGSTLSPPQNAPTWANFDNLDSQPGVPLPPYNSNVVPLYTGYFRIPVKAGFNLTGQFSLEQSLPLPMNVVAVVNEATEGDTPDQAVRNKQQRAA